MLKRLGPATVTLLGALAMTHPAQARVDIHIDLASQTMHVESASGSYDWPISSARSGYRTPHGSFGIRRMEAMHYSHKYHNSPMPHSLFFSGGYAIHGTYATGSLGRPASHGCIRIAPENAAALYEMVASEGGHISIGGGSAPTYENYASQTRTRYARYDRSRYAARPVYRNDGYAWRGSDDPGAALGYAPVRQPSVRTWLDDPSAW